MLQFTYLYLQLAMVEAETQMTVLHTHNIFLASIQEYLITLASVTTFTELFTECSKIVTSLVEVTAASPLHLSISPFSPLNLSSFSLAPPLQSKPKPKVIRNVVVHALTKPPYPYSISSLSLGGVRGLALA